MKTVAELAKVQNVSVQTIYRRLTRLTQDGKESLSVKHGGVTYLTESAEKLLSSCLTGVKQDDKDVKQMLNADVRDVKQDKNTEVVFLRSQVEYLQTELEKEREHSRTLAIELAKIANQSQILQLAANNATNTDTEKKSGFFKRLFSRKDL
jgi:hypothetical protein